MAAITCVIPGLFDLPFEEIGVEFLRGQLPCLNRLLGRSSPIANDAFSIDAILAEALGWPKDTCLPMAAAIKPNNGAADGHTLLFQAIHLKPDIYNAVIIPILHDARFLDEISLLINALQEEFKVDFDTELLADGVFLLVLKDFAAPAIYPHPLSVLGKTVSPYMQQSRAILPWYQLINEMQMFLHLHPVNQRRLLDGLLTVNSLWFWGGGALDNRVDPALGWFSDDDLINRFAAGLGLTPAAISEFRCNAVADHALIIDLKLLGALKTGSGAALTDILLQLEASIFKPLLKCVGAGGQRLMIRAGSSHDFSFSGLSRFKFWRSDSSLLDLARLT